MQRYESQSPTRRKKSLPWSPAGRRRRRSHTGSAISSGRPSDMASEEHEDTAELTSALLARRHDRPAPPLLPRQALHDRLALGCPPAATSDASWMRTLEVLSQRQSWNHTLTSIAQRHKLISSKQGPTQSDQVAPGAHLELSSDWRPSVSFVQPLPSIAGG